jgi:type II secretory pathway component GspD/PulD (secretin)
MADFLKKRICMMIRIGVLCGLCGASPGFSATMADTVSSDVSIECRDDQVAIQAESATLSEILAKIFETFGVTVTGLEDRLSEKVTIHFREKSLEKGIKRLLQRIDESNFAFEFNNTKLVRVVVAPASKISGSSIQYSTEASTDSAPVVRILEIVAGTQAEVMGLQMGDLVMTYGGVEIQSAPQLVDEVNKQDYSRTIEMTVVRDGFPMKVVLNGGLIGIKVQTVMIPQTEYNRYHAP